MQMVQLSFTGMSCVYNIFLIIQKTIFTCNGLPSFHTRASDPVSQIKWISSPFHSAGISYSNRNQCVLHLDNNKKCIFNNMFRNTECTIKLRLFCNWHIFSFLNLHKTIQLRWPKRWIDRCGCICCSNGFCIRHSIWSCPMR